MTTAVRWRAWLQRNHATSTHVWLVVYKKASSKRSLDYESTLDEATAFGWVDGLIRGATDEYYLQLWTPRRRGGNWTEANRARARRLAAEGRLTPAGLAKLPDDLRREIEGG